MLIDGGFEGGLHLYDPQHPQGRLLAPPRGYGASFGPDWRTSPAPSWTAPPGAGPEESLESLRTALAIYRSAAGRRSERVWD